jgi:hypothetical protein
MGLGVFASVLQRVQELRIEACQASQILDIYLIGLAFVGVDKPQLPSVGHQDLMATLLEPLLAQGEWVPASMAMRMGCSEASSDGLWGCAQPTLLHNLTVLCVDEAQVGVPVAEVQSGCHVW